MPYIGNLTVYTKHIGSIIPTTGGYGYTTVHAWYSFFLNSQKSAIDSWLGSVPLIARSIRTYPTQLTSGGETIWLAVSYDELLDDWIPSLPGYTITHGFGEVLSVADNESVHEFLFWNPF